MSLRLRPSLLVVALCAAPLQAGTLKVPSTQFPSIQSAVEAAAPGDVVQVGKGVWHEQVVVGKSGITLRGKSGTVIDAGYAGNCISVSGDDVEISGLTLVNGGLGQMPPGDGAGEAGGLHYVGHGAKLAKLVVHAPEAFGILLEGTGSIDKCAVDGSFGYGIRVITGAAGSGTMTSITRCATRRCITGLSAQDGPFEIEKNSCALNQSVGLELDIDAPAADGGLLPSRVSGNSASGCYVYAMLLSDASGSGLVVEKNSCTGSGYGMLVDGFDVALESNTITDNFLGGLFLSASGCHVGKNKVRGNAGFGISVAFAALLGDSVGVGDNHLEGNTVQDNGGDGLHLSSSANVLEDNLVKSNLGDGIQLEDGGTTGNEVSGNTILDNGHDGLDNWALLTLIRDNVCKGNGGADLAGAGHGEGTTEVGSGNNTTGDASTLESLQELEGAD
jgi:parallel beta-helix repeat protein